MKGKGKDETKSGSIRQVKYLLLFRKASIYQTKEKPYAPDTDTFLISFTPIFPSRTQMTEQLIPFAITIQEDQPSRSEDYIMQCLEHEVPLIISCSTLGSKESNRVSFSKTSNRTRDMGHDRSFDFETII